MFEELTHAIVCRLKNITPNIRGIQVATELGRLMPNRAFILSVNNLGQGRELERVSYRNNATGHDNILFEQVVIHQNETVEQKIARLEKELEFQARTIEQMDIRLEGYRQLTGGFEAMMRDKAQQKHWWYAALNEWNLMKTKVQQGVRAKLLALK